MRLASIATFIFLMILAPITGAVDSDGDGLSDDLESSLAREFSPFLQMDDGEVFFPVSVTYAFNNSVLKRVKDGEYETILQDPSALALSNYDHTDSRYFLDDTHGSIDDNGVRTYFEEVSDEIVPTIYARVTGDSSLVVVQYWFYYPFNDGNLNSHEGDWEMIQFQIREGEPVTAGYSQHLSGQSAEWEEVLLRDEHPIVYVARGSHANYFRSYQGVLGFQNDEVSKSGPVFGPDSYDLVLLGEMGQHEPGQEWLLFSGRWGEWGEAEDELRGRRGPNGPGHGSNSQKWENPNLWQVELKPLKTSWLWLSWFVKNFVIFFGIYLVIGGMWKFFGLGRAVFSRNAFRGLGLGTVLAVAGALLAVLAIWQPWYFVRLEVPDGPYQTQGEVPIMSFSGDQGLQLNDPQSNRGLVNMFNLEIPFGLFLGSSMVFLVLDSLKARSEAELRNRYLWSGIINILLPLIPIIILILALGPFVSAQVESIMGGSAPGPVRDMIDSVSSNPVGGQYTGTISEIGEARLEWGLGKGCYMIILAGLIKIGGSFLCSGKEGRG